MTDKAEDIDRLKGFCFVLFFAQNGNYGNKEHLERLKQI